MNLIVYQMVELEHIHISYGYRVVERLACSSVSQEKFSCLRVTAFVQKIDDVFFSRAVEYRG